MRKRQAWRYEILRVLADETLVPDWKLRLALEEKFGPERWWENLYAPALSSLQREGMVTSAPQGTSRRVTIISRIWPETYHSITDYGRGKRVRRPQAQERQPTRLGAGRLFPVPAF